MSGGLSVLAAGLFSLRRPLAVNHMPEQNRELLVHVSRRAMASEFEVCFPAERFPDGTRAALESLDAVEAIEAQLSFFRAESLVSQINASAAAGPVAVEPWLFELLQTAANLFEATGGAYDITSTPLWEAWGFARRAGRVPSDVELDEARSRVGGHLVELDPARQTVRFRRPGVRINLGSIGKGYALDRCAERLLSCGVTDFLLHGGQSSVLARGGIALAEPHESALRSQGLGTSVPSRTPSGTPSSTANEPPPSRALPAWEVGVSSPQNVGQRLAVLRLRDRALGTSSAQFQSFRHEGRRYGHILDPRSGRPAEGVLSVTVAAPTAALADALSTAFYVLGPDPSLAYCRKHPELGLLMLCPSPRSESPDILTEGLTPDELS